MYFADFIQRLRPIIGDGRAIPKYVLHILKMVIVEPSSEKGYKGVKIVNDIFNDKVSESTLKSYYYGKTEGKGANKQIVGDNINKLAQSIEHYLDTEKFKGCFNNLQFKYEEANKLKDSFKDILADEANDKIVDRLADELKTIILKAAGSKNEALSSVNIVSDAAGVIKKENTLKKGTVLEEVLMENWYSQLEPPSPSFSENELEEIEAIARKMYIYLTEIEDLDLYQYIESKKLSHLYGLSEEEMIRRIRSCIPDEIYEKSKEHYNNLHKISSRLKYYNEMHTYSPLSDTVNTSTSITLEHFLYGIPSSTHLALKNDLKFLSFAIRQLRK
ncbi:hypothetical protein [Ruminococcus flavefaciens]|uniref:hypothetical protein n=1 Tax=Ruminococcus flavefaciens TaxID=1265 RepID=UPI00048BA768|nr:hypothetical protein [Ruminococcus flavefaciens]